MALEALKKYAAEQEQGVNAEIEKMLENDRVGSPTSNVKVRENAEAPISAQAVTKALEGRAAGVYKRQQENVRKAGQLRTDILKGIQDGESPYRLLIKAMECISLMTGDSVFYSQGKAKLQQLYCVFDDPEAKKVEKEEVQERLNRLLKAYSCDQGVGDKRQIKIAIERHKERLIELQ